MASRSHRRSRLSIAAPVSLFLSLIIAGQAVAASWQPLVHLSTHDRAIVGFGITASGSRLHVGYEEAWAGVRHAVYRRSANGGATFGGRMTLSAATAEWAGDTDIAASGSNVDAVWTEAVLDDAGQPGPPWRLRYRRSLDYGATWGTTLALATGAAGVPGVERSGSAVIVTWTDTETGKVQLRRSVDGGATFLSVVTLATTTNEFIDGAREAFPSAAIGDIIYVVYFPNWYTVAVRRSWDGGATWTVAQTLATDASGYGAQIAASGSRALVAYGAWNGKNLYGRVRGTTDKGSHWGTTVSVTTAAAPNEFEPVVAWGGSAWHVAYEGCRDTACASSSVRYRSSTNGTTWSASETVSSGTARYNIVGGVAFTGTPAVVWWDSDAESASDVHVRRKA